MTEESKYNICSNCGAIIEKDVQFCGHCGAEVQLKQEEVAASSQPYTQTEYQPTQQVSGRSTADAESRLRLAQTFAWLGCISSIFAVIAIIFALDAKKTLGDDPRIKSTVTTAIVILVITVLIAIGGSIAYLIVYLLLLGGL